VGNARDGGLVAAELVEQRRELRVAGAVDLAAQPGEQVRAPLAEVADPARALRGAGWRAGR